MEDKQKSVLFNFQGKVLILLMSILLFDIIFTKFLPGSIPTSGFGRAYIPNVSIISFLIFAFVLREPFSKNANLDKNYKLKIEKNLKILIYAIYIFCIFQFFMFNIIITDLDFQRNKVYIQVFLFLFLVFALVMLFKTPNRKK